MDAHYWNDLASTYDESILNSLEEDRGGVVLQTIKRLSSSRDKAADFGCGVGKYLPTLASHFASVEALDHSAKCLRVARTACARFKNVTYRQCNLAGDCVMPRQVDFGVCANVLLMKSDKARMAVLKNLRRGLADGAHLLVVAPSVESALLTHHRREEWKARSGRGRPLDGSYTFSQETGRSVANGLLTITDVPTKHFLREELMILLAAQRFRVLEVEKVQYAWSTEFESPPRWMREPYPWDWMMICRKESGH